MATSMQAVGEKVEFFKDLDLIALIYLLESEDASAAHGDPIAISIAKNWKDGLKGYGPGTIDLKLDEATRSKEYVCAIISLMRRAEEKIEHFGGCVPSYILNGRNVIPGVTFLDYKKSFLIEAIRKLESLVRGDGATVPN